jgi:hypothetical protein
MRANDDELRASIGETYRANILWFDAPKSTGEPAITAPPMSASRALILGSARAAFISILNSSTISAGVFLGALMPKRSSPHLECSPPMALRRPK